LDRETRRLGDQPRWLTSGTLTSASVHGSDRVDESRWRTCESSGAQEDLADGWSRTAVTRVEWRGMRMEYVTRVRFDGLGLKTRTEVPSRNGWHVAASKSLCRGKGIS
jgi:hypothetical protein